MTFFLREKLFLFSCSFSNFQCSCNTPKSQPCLQVCSGPYPLLQRSLPCYSTFHSQIHRPWPYVSFLHSSASAQGVPLTQYLPAPFLILRKDVSLPEGIRATHPSTLQCNSPSVFPTPPMSNLTVTDPTNSILQNIHACHSPGMQLLDGNDFFSQLILLMEYYALCPSME